MTDPKPFLERAVAAGFRRLPPQLRAACLETELPALPFDLFTNFRAAASAAHIVDVGVVGAYGLFSGPPYDQRIMRDYSASGYWAKDINDLVRNTLMTAGGGTYLDIGANLGLTVVPTADLPGVQVHAFEPEPRNFRYLNMNVQTNCPTAQVTLHNVALTDRCSTVKLELSNDNSGDHRLRVQGQGASIGEEVRQVIPVEGVRLDDLPIAAVDPVVIKVDTQGAEPLVLKGGERLFRRAALVILEYCPYLMDRMGTDWRVVQDFLSGCDDVEFKKGWDWEQDLGGVSASGEGGPAAESAAAVIADIQVRYDETPHTEYWDIVAHRS